MFPDAKSWTILSVFTHCADDMSLSIHHRDACNELRCRVTWELTPSDPGTPETSTTNSSRPSRAQKPLLRATPACRGTDLRNFNCLKKDSMIVGTSTTLSVDWDCGISIIFRNRATMGICICAATGEWTT